MPPLQILENYNSLYHTQPSPPPQPTGNFLIKYFLIIFLFLNSRAHFRDLYHGHQIQICRKIALYFSVLMQIPRSIMSRIKTRQSNKLCGWKFITDINRRYYLKQTKIFGGDWKNIVLYFLQVINKTSLNTWEWQFFISCREKFKNVYCVLT